MSVAELHHHMCTCAECCPNREDLVAGRRSEARFEYVRAHAPTILAGLLSHPDCNSVQFFPVVRRQAIEQAGLLFDETESP